MSDDYGGQGGVQSDTQFLGAIGVGGSGLDEECADYALTQVLGPQPPLTPNIPARPPLMGDPPL